MILLSQLTLCGTNLLALSILPLRNTSVLLAENNNSLLTPYNTCNWKKNTSNKESCKREITDILVNTTQI